MTELTTLFTGRRLIKLTTTDSTNRHLSRMFSSDNIEEGTAFMSAYQSAGEGMAGNYWHSEQGKNLLVSFFFRPNFLSAKKIFLFNKTIAVALYNTISHQFPIPNSQFLTSIKWPNDIYVDDEKISGIKIETSIRNHQVQHAIVGIGININQENFPSEIPNPTSLKLITQKEYSLESCFNLLCNEIEKQYLSLKSGHEQEINHDYLKSLYRKDKLSDFEDATGRFQGIIKDVDEEGHLCLQEANGSLRKYEMKDLNYII